MEERNSSSVTLRAAWGRLVYIFGVILETGKPSDSHSIIQIVIQPSSFTDFYPFQIFG